MAKARVLSVDDQRYFRELIAGLLAEEGYETETAASGEEALRVLERSTFDLVLTDLVMPGMDGSELVRRVKQRDPEQEVIVVTGVVDVGSAVEAMKLGASDYLLKPLDRRALAVTLEGALARRRVRAERDRLLAENLDYIAETQLLERALGLFASLSVEAFAGRLLRALCVETGAQGAALWVASAADPGRLELAGVHGLVRVAEEPEWVDATDLPATLADEGACVALVAGGARDRGPALVAALRRDGRLVGLARLSDRLEGERFEESDRVGAEKLVRHAEVALAHALRLRALEHRSFEDPATGVWRHEFLRDVARGELEKAQRFGRSLALLAVDPCWAAPGGPGAAGVEAFARALAGVLRATDLLAVDERGRFHVLLAECDALGAAVFKRRCVESLGRSEALAVLGEGARPQPRLASASCPGDGVALEALERALEARLEAGRRSIVASLSLERLSLPDALRALLREGIPVRSETPSEIAGFALAECGRRPRERRLVFVAPGVALAGAVQEAFAALRGARLRSEIVLLGGERPPVDAPTAAWVAPERVGALPPCVVVYGDGAAYAMVRAPLDASGATRLFHSSDRELAEYLAFRLQAELLPARPLEAAA